MTDDELSRIRQTLNDALMMVGDPRQNQFAKRGKIEAKLHAATRMIEAAFDRRKEGEGGDDAERLSARITEYLSAGGLWNPECMDHDKVRRLLIDCRNAFDAAIADHAIKAAIAQVDAARTEGKGNG